MKKQKTRKQKTISTPTPTPTQSNNLTFDKSPSIPQRSKLKSELKITHRELTDKQTEFINLTFNKETKIIFVSGPAGSSKAQPLDSKILTDNGWIEMKNIKPGDKVFGEDGNIHNVISIHPQGIKDIYKISFSDESFTECTLDHLWWTQTSKDRNQRKWTPTINGKRFRIKSNSLIGSVKTTLEISNTLFVRNKTRINHSIPITQPINFKKCNHEISPYIMGALLGDGCFRKKGYVSFTSNDIEIIHKINEELPVSVEIKKIKSSKFDYSISQIEKKVKSNIVTNEISRLGLNDKTSVNKFIPHEYKFDSVENRIELLRGLLDTDGHISKKTRSIYFTTVSKLLSDDVRFLIESLGGICKVSIRENFYSYKGEIKKGKNSYSICICLPPDINPFYLKRKRELVMPRSKYKPIRYITNIEFIDKKECQCILLDNPSHLYITNNFIVTHNTFLSVLCALKMLNERKVSDLIYIRSAVECSDSKLGFLPGEINDKMAPYIQPLTDKMSEFLNKGDIDMLIKEERVSATPVGFLRGLNWNAKCIIADEGQNMSYKELFTLITRIGEFSKVFILGDPDQSDINGKSGFLKMMTQFDDEESRQNGIHIFKFTEDDIVRSGIVQFIIKKSKKSP